MNKEVETVEDVVLDAPTIMDAAHELRTAQQLFVAALDRDRRLEREKKAAELSLANAKNHLATARQALDDVVGVGVMPYVR